jgi:hypothetical protein
MGFFGKDFFVHSFYVAVFCFSIGLVCFICGSIRTNWYEKIDDPLFTPLFIVFFMMGMVFFASEDFL